MEKDNIRAILFDLDGTIFRSEACDYIAWNEALKKFNITVPLELYPLYTGKSEEWVENDIRQRYDSSIKEGEIIRLKKEIFIKMFGTEEIVLMPYAEEAIKYFFDRNFSLAICTGGHKQEVDIKLRNNNLRNYFSSIVTSSDVESNKPAPDVYLKAMEGFGLSGINCLAIEDTQTGVQAAKSAGAFCFAIPSEFSETQDFSKADMVLDSLKSVIDFFENKPD
jgi:HAD superfamily hydrolase (TIGR01509 family)